eukprot:31044-Pelagococcus_subviridis.AAC.5
MPLCESKSEKPPYAPPTTRTRSHSHVVPNIGGFPDVADLRRHRDELVHGGQHERRRPRLGRGPNAGRGQGVEEPGHGRVHAVERVRVRGEIRHRPRALDDGGANLLQIRDDRVPVRVHPLRERSEVFQLREPAELLADVPGDGVLRVEAARGDGVPAGLDPGFHPGARLVHELLEDVPIRELRVEEHLRHEVVHHPGLRGRALAPEHEVRGDVVAAAHGRREGGEGEPAGLRAHGLVEFDKVPLVRAHALHRAAPQRDERHEVHGDRVEVLLG